MVELRAEDELFSSLENVLDNLVRLLGLLRRTFQFKHLEYLRYSWDVLVLLVEGLSMLELFWIITD